MCEKITVCSRSSTASGDPVLTAWEDDLFHILTFGSEEEKRQREELVDVIS